ncbi:Hypothetical predicted protein [Mytilus galloprovincialis]|uniref:DUF985 domain-containing protein n=1 Tax=Mytilus galloprovincialis TaxID=29158 RepID=A0A8B6D0W5_MYTGA|nr:Hypothetical predicted protein [Mytilus galloprovincialis]
MADNEIQKIVEQFKMVHHPESGYFKEVWRGERQVTFTQETTHDGKRDVGSSIYSLLINPNFISWHQVRSDEIYNWHAGGTLKVHLIDKDGNHTCTMLGDGVKNPECVYQSIIPHDTWYSAELTEGSKYVLFGAVVFPGWELKDWTEGNKEELIAKFPQHKDLFTRLTKPK